MQNQSKKIFIDTILPSGEKIKVLKTLYTDGYEKDECSEPVEDSKKEEFEMNDFFPELLDMKNYKVMNNVVDEKAFAKNVHKHLDTKEHYNSSWNSIANFFETPNLEFSPDSWLFLNNNPDKMEMFLKNNSPVAHVSKLSGITERSVIHIANINNVNYYALKYEFFPENFGKVFSSHTTCLSSEKFIYPMSSIKDISDHFGKYVLSPTIYGVFSTQDHDKNYNGDDSSDVVLFKGTTDNPDNQHHDDQVGKWYHLPTSSIHDLFDSKRSPTHTVYYHENEHDINSHLDGILDPDSMKIQSIFPSDVNSLITDYQGIKTDSQVATFDDNGHLIEFVPETNKKHPREVRFEHIEDQEQTHRNPYPSLGHVSDHVDDASKVLENGYHVKEEKSTNLGSLYLGSSLFSGVVVVGMGLIGTGIYLGRKKD